MSNDSGRGDGIRRGPPSGPAGRGSGSPSRPGEFGESEPESEPTTRNDAKTLVIIIAVAVGVAFVGLVTCVGLIAYIVVEVKDQVTKAAAAAQNSATAAMQNAGKELQEQNNYKQIVLAMHAYEAEHRSFPPAAMKTRNGKPGLSWRVALLPYLGQNVLYSHFKLDEPWDAPTNRHWAAHMPMVYASPADQSRDHTRIRLIVGKGAIYESDRVLKRNQITDGLSQTILLVESADDTMWTQPDELKFDPDGPLPEFGSPDRDFFFVAMADGQVRRIRKTIPPDQIKAAITAAGNEPVNLDQ